MAIIKLTKVDIVADKYFAKFDTDGSISKEEIDSTSFDSVQSKVDAVWLSSARKISFDTPTGQLRDGEYATQLNGFHWVKITGYAVIKVRPGVVTNNALQQKGIEEVKLKSVEE